MFTSLCKFAVLLVLVAFCLAEPTHLRWQSQRLVFPGPTINRPLPILEHLEEATPNESAPYPPAGLRPEPAFELPEQAYGPPEQTYGPPEQTYGPPEQTYGPPEQTYGPPAIEQPVDNNSLPQSASIIAPSPNFFQQTHITLPLPERLVAFRPQRRPSALRRPNNIRRPAKLRRQPQPAKLIVSISH